MRYFLMKGKHQFHLHFYKIKETSGTSEQQNMFVIK